MRWLRVLAVLLCAPAMLSFGVLGADIAPAAAVVPASVAGTYTVTFTPAGQPSFSYDWVLASDHTMTGGGYSGTWKYHRGNTHKIAVYYVSPFPCTFTGTGSPQAGFSGNYVCPTGTSGTWYTTSRR
jgi:hypothetical protein